MSYKENAKELAAQGRFGDDRLLHVSEVELKGLASLVPGGLPINPKTGLPEAFFFLPFLAAAAPAAAGAAAAAVPAITAGLGAAGAGAASAAGLGALTAGMGAGMTAAAGGLGAAIPAATTAATALPAAAMTAAPALTGGAMSGLTGGLGALAPTAATAAPTMASVAPSLSILPGEAAAATAPAASGIGALGSDAALGGAALTNAAPMLPATAPIPTASPLGGAAATAPTAAPAGGISALGSDASLGGAALTNAGAPAAAAAPAEGGILGGLSNGNMLQYAAMAAMMMPQGGGGDEEGDAPDTSKVKYKGGEPNFPGSDFKGGIDPEWDYFKNENYQYAEGGLAALMPPETPPAKNSDKDQQLIEATVAAIQGQAGPQGEAIIQEFIKTFGQQALQDLIVRLQGAGQQGGQPGGQMMSGGGDGMSDSIPATLSGQQGQAPAKLSDGEYVVPADVVSGLGNGSTNAGAQQLEQMSGRVRGMRNGGMVGQPPAINPRKAMPV